MLYRKKKLHIYKKRYTLVFKLKVREEKNE